ncbi:universal stress protein [Guptibacillus algicola]|uniref:universal stress protein n=1 Tax=Guptibacillus algicola TaxID=225844 RepID=UPI001CD2B363|nr:universal stress protein [Alkalihalobacillus algicola]MCA0987677.1 universal stress protein [Alkalihalobacillus algicola]
MKQYNRVLVAFDGSELSVKALDEAIKMAEENPDLHLDIITALNPTAQISSAVIYASVLNELRRDAVNMLNEVSEKVTERIPDHVTKTMVLEGNPGEELVNYADENHCDLIVMGSRGLSGIKEIFLGSVSHNVLQRANCPVLVIK